MINNGQQVQVPALVLSYPVHSARGWWAYLTLVLSSNLHHRYGQFDK